MHWGCGRLRQVEVLDKGGPPQIVGKKVKVKKIEKIIFIFGPTWKMNIKYPTVMDSLNFKKIFFYF